MDNDKKTGIQLSRQPATREISVVGGGIKINASEKPIASSFVSDSGWIYMILDCSGSMKRAKLDQARSGIISFTRDAFKKGYRVGFIKFSDQEDHLCGPTDNLDVLQNAMKDLRGSGSTNLTDALKTAHLKLKDFTTGTKVMIIATDGMPDNVKSSLEAAGNAKADGIEIITIGTDDANKDFLTKLASRTELSSKVSSDKFSDAIAQASLLLMSPKGIVPK
jgi:Mg-chelatase subunit ChlD